MKTVLVLLSALMQLVMLNFYFGRVLDAKTPYSLLRFCGSACFVLVLSLYSYYLLFNPVAPIVYMLIVFLYSLVMHKGAITKKLLFTFLLLIYSMLCDVMTAAILTNLYHVSMENIKGDLFFYVQGYALSVLFLFVVFRIIGLGDFNYRFLVKRNQLYSLSIIPLSSVVFIYFFTNFGYNDYQDFSSIIVLLCSLLLLLSNIAVFYFLEKQAQLQKSEDSLLHLQKQYRLQSEYYQELKEHMLDTNRNIHDVKNFIVAVSSYLDKNETEQAKQKIEEFYKKIPTASAFNTGNDAVNALLLSKWETIRREIPRSDILIMLPPLSKVDEIDLCILIGNAIDNAAEACIKISNPDDRYLDIRILPQLDMISVLIENSKVAEESSVPLKTSKKDTFLHGYGIENMKSICRKYEGDLVLENKPGRFIVSALLPV